MATDCHENGSEVELKTHLILNVSYLNIGKKQSHVIPNSTLINS